MNIHTAQTTASNTLYNKINWKKTLLPTNRAINDPVSPTISIHLPTQTFESLKINKITLNVIIPEYTDSDEDNTLISVTHMHDDEIVNIPALASPNNIYHIDYHFDELLDELSFLQHACKETN